MAGIVIIGGGLAGAQVAIQLRQRRFAGPVTLLSAEAHPPYWRPPLSKFILEGTEDAASAALRPTEFWERRRIDLRLGTAALRLDDGQSIMFDHLLVCVGIRPDTGLAMDAGLACQDGILVDHQLRSSDPAIFALGDCARFPSQRYGKTLRLESIQNAIDGAAVVAAAICGDALCYDPLPIISSLQFGHQLDFIGLASATCVPRRYQTDDDAALVVLHEETSGCVATECLDASPDTIKTLRGLIAGAAVLDKSAIG